VNDLISDVAGAVQAVRNQWGWYLTLGIVLIAAGVLAIIYQGTATQASVVVFGALLIIAGVTQLIAAFQSRGAGHVILLLLIGILDVVVGWMLIQHPDAGALTLTLLLAALFVFTGLYQFIAAMWLQLPNYGWYALSGIISVVLGVLLWMQWPISAEWFIGFAVGLYFIFAGIAWSTFAIKIRPTAAVQSQQ
jgi:uncharacterized membrane protein HdeD (DUF308 family)